MVHDTLSPTMQAALEAAAHPAGLWRHHGRAGYYVPGLGTVPFTQRTINALVARGLVEVRAERLEHAAVYVETIVQRGALGERVVPVCTP